MNRYRNFDIDLRRVEGAGGDGGLAVRALVAASPVGELRDAQARTVAAPEGFRARLRAVERRQADAEALMALGEDLAVLLLPAPVRDLLRRARDTLAADEGLRIRIRAHDDVIAGLPWEYAYVARDDVPTGRRGPEGFLALDRSLSLVRYELQAQRPGEIAPRAEEKIRVRALLSDARGAGHAELDLDREELHLRQALDGVAGVDVAILRPGTRLQLETALEGGAEVLHFSGHGTFERGMGAEPGSVEGRGRLLLATEDRGVDEVPAEAFAVKLQGSGVRLAVLNACEGATRDDDNPWSGIAGALARAGIPAVVAMQYRIRDASAIAFAHRFYRALAGGANIDTATAAGRQAVFDLGGAAERDWGVPVLYLRSAQGQLFPPPRRPFLVALGLFVATMLVLGAWFALHLYPRVADWLGTWARVAGLGGGALVLLWALVRALGSLLARNLGRETLPWHERLLRHPRAGPVLAVSLVASLALFLATQSIYLEVAGPVGGEVVVRVETPAGNPLNAMPGLRVSDADDARLGGGPFFQLPWAGPVRFAVEQPAGWSVRAPQAHRASPFRRVHLYVGGEASDFDARDFFVLRIVPGSLLLSVLPVPDTPAPGMPFFACVSVVGAGPSAPRRCAPVRWGMIVTGTSEALIEASLEAETSGERAEALAALPCMIDTEGQAWVDNVQVVPAPEFGRGDTLRIEIVPGSESGTMMFEDTVEVSSLVPGGVTSRCFSPGVSP